mmetsp:Transcript_7111/g.13498  ORF Transcript_7111/g.13498 Transcript_7111/m.13498 type:complete len:200 (-) Transcript_7111:706-1305(-)
MRESFKTVVWRLALSSSYADNSGACSGVFQIYNWLGFGPEHEAKIGNIRPEGWAGAGQGGAASGARVPPLACRVGHTLFLQYNRVQREPSQFVQVEAAAPDSGSGRVHCSLGNDEPSAEQDGASAAERVCVFPGPVHDVRIRCGVLQCAAGAHPHRQSASRDVPRLQAQVCLHGVPGGLRTDSRIARSTQSSRSHLAGG